MIMTGRQQLSVLDLCKDQVTLTNLWPDPVVKNSRNCPVHDGADEQRQTEGCRSCISQGDETQCQPNLLRDSKMYSSTPECKSKGNHNKVGSFFGIDIDKENAFLKTEHLSSFISSQLSERVLLPISDNINATGKLCQTEDAVKNPANAPKKILFPLGHSECDLEPREVLGNNLSNLRASVAQEISLPRIEIETEFGMKEASTPYCGVDEVVLCPSPSSFLQEVTSQSSTPLRGSSNEYVRNKGKISNDKQFPEKQQNQNQICKKPLRNNDPNISLSVSHQQCQSSPDRNDSAKKSSVLVELGQKDSEKHNSSMKVVPVSMTCQKTHIISDGEADNKMGSNLLSPVTKDHSSSMLPEQCPTDGEVDNKMGSNLLSPVTKDHSSRMLPEQCPISNLGIGNILEKKIYTTNHRNMNMFARKALTTTFIKYMTPEKDSAISSKFNERDNTYVIDGPDEATGEEDLSASFCNMSMNEGVGSVDIKNEMGSNLITIDKFSDRIDSFEILKESGDICETQIGIEGESHKLQVSGASNNENKELTNVKGKVPRYPPSVSECFSQSSDQINFDTKTVLKLDNANKFPLIPQGKEKNELEKIEPPLVIEKNITVLSKSEGEGLQEPVKAYMLPFVSSDPQENKDNEDAKWSYLAKLETDEERYQLSRKLWKSIVVPDPNVDMTYFGCLRRWRTWRNASKGVSSIKRTVSQNRKRRLEDNLVGQPPMKRARGILDVNFSFRRFEEIMKVVTMNYEEELNHYNLSHQQALKMERTYNEKIHQLVMARSEVEALHKFYSGLPDQELSVSQASVEAEQWDIEQFYTRFKRIYGWDGRAFIH